MREGRATTRKVAKLCGLIAGLIAMNPLIPANEQDRLAALRSYGVLDTPSEAVFDRITTLAARIFDVPIATMSLIDERRQWYKSCIGIAPAETPRELAFARTPSSRTNPGDSRRNR